MAVSDYTALFEAAGRKHNVDPALLAAVATQESGGNPRAKSPQGALGLMQIMPGTARGLGNIDPLDPEQAVDGAARLLAASLEKHGDVPTALREYHGGPDRRLWGPKNAQYWKDVMNRYAPTSDDTLAGGSGQDDLDSLIMGGSSKPKASSGPMEPASAPGGSPATGAQPQGSPLTGSDASGDDLDALIMGGAPGAPEKPSAPKVEKKTYGDMDAIPIGETGDYTNEGQTKTYWALVRGKAIDPKAPVGSIKNPVYTHGDVAIDHLSPGTVYVDMDGKLRKRADGALEGDPLKGMGQGVADVVLSLGELIPGTEDSELRNVLKSRQMQFDAETHTEEGKGNAWTQGGRLAGQTAASLPLVAGAEAAAAPVLANAGGVGAFLAGKAGQAALPEAATVGAKVANTALKGASRFTAGAGEGATAAAAVSSASDEPLADQLKTGALLGGALHTVAPAIVKGVRRFVGGAERATVDAASEAAKDTAAGRAMSPPIELSAGQATGSPKQQMIESEMLKGVHGEKAQSVMATHRAEQSAALNANATNLTDRIGGQTGTEYGSGGEVVSKELNAARDAHKAKVDAKYAAARAEPNSAMLSTAKDLREFVLNDLGYDQKAAPLVFDKVENLGANGAPTLQEVYELRAALSNLSRGVPSYDTISAGKAVKALDAYMEKAVKDGEILGDAGVVRKWNDAINEASGYFKKWKTNDIVHALVKRGDRGGDFNALAVAPEDAADAILGKGMAWIGKKNVNRDMARLKSVLGGKSDGWNAIRAETFRRLVTEGRGPPNPAEPGMPQFSGQKFMKAWDTAKTKNGALVRTMFTPEEITAIDDFARIAHKATTPVKGGVNASDTATGLLHKVNSIAGKFWTAVGGATGGAVGSIFPGPGTAIGGGAGATAGGLLDQFLKDAKSLAMARRATEGVVPRTARPTAPLNNKLLKLPTKGELLSTAGTTAAVAGRNRLSEPSSAPVR